MERRKGGEKRKERRVEEVKRRVVQRRTRGGRAKGVWFQQCG